MPELTPSRSQQPDACDIRWPSCALKRLMGETRACLSLARLARRPETLKRMRRHDTGAQPFTQVRGSMTACIGITGITRHTKVIWSRCVSQSGWVI